MATPMPYDPEVGDEICVRISDGLSLRQVLKDENMPSAPTFYKWIRESDDFAKQYAQACADRADSIFDEMFDIADDGVNDWVERDGKTEYNGDHVQRSRLRIDTRKWALARMAPKKYGDKLDLTHGNPDGSALSFTLRDMTKD